MDPKEHIEIIQQERDGTPTIKKMLRNTLRELAEKLYSKDTHFIFELIQNAEDNSYEESNEPSLIFRLLSIDPTNTPGSNGALLIENNEVGFTPKNVNAICNAGKEGSTKTGRDGYIGEKGIGFKSVFRISSIPHIFSNGYAFNLPEHDEPSSFGYIYPRWVDTIPNDFDLSSTTIVLPLNKKEYGFEKIEETLRDIKPEVILFLSKLKKLEVIVDEHYELTICKDESQYPLVNIYKEKHDIGSDSKLRQEEKYLVHTESFNRPEGLKTEERKDIYERHVTVALPLTPDSKSAGQIFAYLPVKQESDLPFLLNADFLLPSDRESILMKNKWNEWLRDCVADVFVKAFESAVDNEDYQMQAYSFIPLTANDEFFKPVVESIQEKLKISKVILTQPDLKRCKPEDAMTAPKKFRSLITEPYPQHLLSQRLLCPELETFNKQLRAIGVRELKSQDIIICLTDGEWIKKQGLEWLVRCYKYLSESKLDELTSCFIVPIRHKASDSVRFSCDDEQAIYFECDDETKDIFSEVPSCVNVPLAFLDSKFYQLIKNDEDLHSWMTKTLHVYSFSRPNYAVDVINWLKEHFHEMTDEELVSITYFLAQFDNIDDIPVLLDTSERELLSQVKTKEEIQEVVTPISLDPEMGWQNIFQIEGDRSHLAILSDEYLLNDGINIEELIEFWKKLGITAHPLPKCSNKKCYSYANSWGNTVFDNSLTKYEQKLADKVKPNSAVSRLTEMTIQNYITPDTIIKQISGNRKTLSRSIIHWLDTQINELDKWRYNKKLSERGLMVEITYQYHGPSNKYFNSSFLNSLKNRPWLFTTKGFVKPSEAFLPEKHIKDIFENSVPYVEDDISEDVVKLLGIRKEATVEELLDVLANHAKKHTGSKDFTYRVYKYLNLIEIDQNIVSRFKEENLIYVPSHEDKWLSSKNVIWLDRSDVLGDDFAYLEKIYSKLIDFFVDILGVKKDVDTEHFAERWLTLQKKDNIPHDEMKNILTSIYQELLPICKKEDNERPDWWHRFVQDANIWTQGDTFVNPVDVYVPDDGDLKQIFRDNNIHFAWRPEKNSFAQWESLYRALDIPYLSESVDISLVDEAKYPVVGEPKYLTKASKVLIITWLAEKVPNNYERLQNSNLLESLLNTGEAYSDPIHVVYELDYKKIEKEREAYWVQDNETLVLSQSSNHGKLKNMIALTLARALMSNRAYKDFANWIELILCETDWNWRVKQHNWHVPEDVKVCLRINTQSGDLGKTNRQDVSEGNDPGIASSDEEEAPGEEVTYPEYMGQNIDPEIVDVDPSPEPHVPCVIPPPSFTPSGGGASPDNLVENGEKKTLVNRSDFNINRLGHTKINEIELDPPGRVINQDIRGQRIQKEYENKIYNEPEHADRRFKTERTIFEGPDEQVREYLKQLYEGKCQICGKTFPERNGNPFFIANYIVPRKNARFCDTPANALCLCAEHFAKWQHGALEAEIVDQIMAFRTENESDDLTVEIKLCGEECNIHYRPKHIFDLQKLIESLG